jgi:DNA repair protein SbcC/Rad50
MIPLRVYLKGFMSYRDEATLSFDGASLWVLSGPNGAGKSAIFDAITFALYGHHRGGRQNVKDLINHHADALAVEFDFSMDEIAYRVRPTVPRRGRGTREAFILLPTGPEPVADTDMDDGFKRWRETIIGLEYDTFTSSVILLQGQCEKLLDMRPGERHKALSELIDLSPYKRLHEAAGERRQHHRSLAEEYGNQLQGTPIVSDEELAAAKNTVEQAEKSWREAGAQVETFVELVGFAREWERLKGDLADRQGEAEKARALLDREEEIRTNFERLQQIRQTLPVIEPFVENKGRLAGNKRREGEAKKKVRGIERELEEATAKKGEANGEVERLTRRTGELQKIDADLANRVNDLLPKAEHLKRLEEAQTECQEAKESLDALLPDLEWSLEHAEKEDGRLAEAERALPWLELLAQSRSALSEALLTGGGASVELQALSSRLQEHKAKYESLSIKVEEAREEENRLAHEVTGAQERRKDILKRRASFDDVSAQRRCELCGQEITQEHAEQEMAHLDARVAETEAKLEDSKGFHEQVKGRLEALEGKLAEAKGVFDELLGDQARLKNECEQAKQDARRHSNQAENSFVSLPMSYQARVTSQALEGADWAATTYPDDSELEELKREVDGRVTCTERLQELREQLGQKRRWDALFQSASQRLSKLLETLSWDEARHAHDELGKSQDRRQELSAEITELEQAHQKASVEVKKCDEALERLHGELKESEAELAKLQAAQTEIERALRATLEVLPDDWRKQAESAGLEELEAWRDERNRLAEYEALFADMEHASRSIADLERRIAELGTRIGELPEEARRPSGEVEEELSRAKSFEKEEDAEWRAAERHLGELERRRDRRSELEDRRQKAERWRGAYDVLYNFLGPRGLQARLLRAAERELVLLANEILDGLSRGRMQLDLRKVDDQHGALDLVVYDGGTGSEPVAVSLASGSQKFRIAVSLALAIGRYKGQQARRIESVIVDEGFGSLDKNGRDDMIQVLNDLQQELKRVILVSHQEEFANAFTNGYTIALEENSSKVERLQLSAV